MPGRIERTLLRVELLEDRMLLSPFVVVNTNDSGTGSLRAAITQVNSDLTDTSASPDQIDFDIPNSDPGYDRGTWTITPTSALPAITNSVIIDGTTQPTYSGAPVIIVDGTSVAGDGLVLDSLAATSSAGSTIKGLEIDGFGGAGIHIKTNSNLIESNGLGADQTGVQVDSASGMDNTIGGTTAAQGNLVTHSQQNGILIGAGQNVVDGNMIGQNTGNGVEVSNTTNNTIGGLVAGARNFIFGNFQDGILLIGDFTSANLVAGNWIGTDTTGSGPFANSGNGIEIDANSNSVGGTTALARNVVSGNSQDGILITGNQNVVEGNYVGTDSTGTTALSNGLNGIEIDDSDSNIIGGIVVSARNVITGNRGRGILLSAGALNNQVEGNYIGVDATGNGLLGNDSSGVEVNSSSSNTIGGASVAAGNLILANSGEGILITSGGSNSAMGNTIAGNSDNGVWIFDATGPNTIGGMAGNFIAGNAANGVLISTSARSSVEGNRILENSSNGIDLNVSNQNTIGGTTSGDANIVAGNLGDGVLIQSSSSNLLESNRLEGGLRSGVEITGSSLGNIIGGTTPTAANTIEGQFQDGVAIEGALAQFNLVEGNSITDNGEGVELIESISNFVGGTANDAGNVISGNRGSGIRITGGVSGDQVLGNFIGTDSSGQNVDPNGVDGVDLIGANYISIGGTAAGDRNVISGNLGNGISLTAGATNDLVLGNYIGTDGAGSRPLPNGGDGVYLANVTNNTIGGIEAGSRNVISGNDVSGISLAAGATNHQILGNNIGTDSSGLKFVPNIVDGVDLIQATADTIGGPAAGAGNLISGNTLDGISLSAGASSNEVLGNLIGTNVSGTGPLPNNGDGVNLASAPGNTIGGTATGDRNVISGNAGSGIDLTTAANGNLVVGNFIGTDESGESPVGNVDGISISAASGNIVGGIAPGAANVISGNTSIGIQISNTLASGNTVLGNLIGTDKDGTRVLLVPNSTTGLPVGILINDSPANTIGGTTAGAGNVIAGFGVAVNVSSFNASGNAIQGNRIGIDQSGKVLTNANVIGIYINGAGQNIVGGATSDAGNIIMGYKDYGVYLFGSQSTGNVVQGNQIGRKVAIKELAAKNPTQQLAGVGIQGASSNLIGGATRGLGNTILGNAYAGVYIFGQANSASNNRIKNNLFNNNSYGILLFNAANNGQYFTLLRSNRFGKNPIARVREFTGPVPRTTTGRHKAATSGPKQGHSDVRPQAPRHQSLESRDAASARKV